MALHIASLLRNEADRFLPRVLDVWSSFANEILVLDDGSTDDTRRLCKDAGAHVITGVGDAPAWGREAPARTLLFEAAWAHARLGDYILILDGDMIPAKDPRILMTSGADAVFFVLFDLWATSPLVYREDEFWRGHLFPRVWMIRKDDHDRTWTWPERGVHCGHLPMNYTFESHIYAPRDHGLLHYAYTSPELREEKYISYARVANQLTPHEIAHARSILDPEPPLVSLDFIPDYVL